MVKKRSGPKKRTGEKPKTRTVRLKIDRQIPENLPTVFANHFVVQSEASVFYMIFFQVQSPMLVGDAAEQAKQIAGMDAVPAKCVARVVLPLDQMPQIIEAMTTNFQRNVDPSSAEITASSVNGKS